MVSWGGYKPPSGPSSPAPSPPPPFTPAPPPFTPAPPPFTPAPPPFTPAPRPPSGGGGGGGGRGRSPAPAPSTPAPFTPAPQRTPTSDTSLMSRPSTAPKTINQIAQDIQAQRQQPQQPQTSTPVQKTFREQTSSPAPKQQGVFEIITEKQSDFLTRTKGRQAVTFGDFGTQFLRSFAGASQRITDPASKAEKAVPALFEGTRRVVESYGSTIDINKFIQKAKQKAVETSFKVRQATRKAPEVVSTTITERNDILEKLGTSFRSGASTAAKVTQTGIFVVGGATGKRLEQEPEVVLGEVALDIGAGKLATSFFSRSVAGAKTARQVAKREIVSDIDVVLDQKTTATFTGTGQVPIQKRTADVITRFKERVGKDIVDVEIKLKPSGDVLRKETGKGFEVLTRSKRNAEEAVELVFKDGKLVKKSRVEAIGKGEDIFFDIETQAKPKKIQLTTSDGVVSRAITGEQYKDILTAVQQGSAKKISGFVVRESKATRQITALPAKSKDIITTTVKVGDEPAQLKVASKGIDIEPVGIKIGKTQKDVSGIFTKSKEPAIIALDNKIITGIESNIKSIPQLKNIQTSQTTVLGKFRIGGKPLEFKNIGSSVRDTPGKIVKYQIPKNIQILKDAGQRLSITKRTTPIFKKQSILKDAFIDETPFQRATTRDTIRKELFKGATPEKISLSTSGKQQSVSLVRKVDTRFKQSFVVQPTQAPALPKSIPLTLGTPVTRTLPFGLSALLGRITSLTGEKTKLDIVPKTKNLVDLNTMAQTKNITDSITKNESISSTESLNQSLTKQQQVVVQQTKQQQVTELLGGGKVLPTQRLSGINLTKNIPTLKIPFFGLDLKKQSAKSFKEDGYDVFVREKGKMVKVNKEPKPYNRAFNLGARATDNTPSATFTLKKSKTPADVRKYPDQGKDLLLGLKFSKNKKNPNNFEEQNKFRIDTKGELQGITVKGWLANRDKARSKAALNSFLK